jgi:hypothetical protein
MLEKDKLEIFLKSEYRIYLDLIKLSNENRDKYFRLYIVIMSALIVFLGKTYLEIGFKGNFFILTIFISVATLLVSYVTGEIVISARRGSVDGFKRINIIRGLLRMISSNEFNKLDMILLPTHSTRPDYFNMKSVDVKLLLMLSVIISTSLCLVLVSLLLLFGVLDRIQNTPLLPFLVLILSIIISYPIRWHYKSKLVKYEDEQFKRDRDDYMKYPSIDVEIRDYLNSELEEPRT